MIRNFLHSGLEDFFIKDSKAGIRPEHAKRLKLILALVNAARSISDVGFPGSRLHKLHGDREGFWSVSVSGNWRVIFRFEDDEVQDVDYVDYH
jgi:toxin HigB-1